MPYVDITRYDSAIEGWHKNASVSLGKPIVEGTFAKTRVGANPNPELDKKPGSFAVVYKLKTTEGQIKAVRAFFHDKTPEERGRLRAVADWINSRKPEYLVPFSFHEKCLRVMMEENGRQEFGRVPLIIMNWIDGDTLFDAICRFWKSNQKSQFEALVIAFTRLLAKMSDDGVAHGDLSSSNIMVSSDNRKLLLVDYDDLLVPGLSIVGRSIGGQPGYQHKNFATRKYGPNMDSFSALSIYVSLLALSVEPDLFDRLNLKRNLTIEGLLFSADDYRSPKTSEAFEIVRRIGNQALQRALGKLEAACGLDVDEVRFPSEYLLRDPASDLIVLVAAISSDDDQKILAAWRDSLDNYPPARAHYARVEVARRRRAQIIVLRAAIATGDDDAIAAAFTSELQSYSKLGLSGSETFTVTLARQRVSAFRRLVSVMSGPHDERDILREYDKELAGYWGMTDAIKQAVKEAKRVENMPKAVRKAIRAGDESALLNAYDPSLERPFYPFTDAQRAAITTAVSRRDALTTFLAAFVVDDEIKIVKAWNSILEAHPAITKAQRDRLELARRQVNALNLLRQVLTSGGSDSQIVQAYNKILDQSRNLTSIERERVKDAFAAVRFATELSHAIKNEDDEKIAAVFNGRHFRLTSAISQDQFRRIWTAFEVVEKLARFRQAIRDGHDELIVSLASELPSNPRYPTQDELLVVAQARERLQLQTEFRDALRKGDDDALVARFAPFLKTQASAFTAANRQRIEVSQRRLMALRALRASLGSTGQNSVTDAVDRDSVLAMDLTPDERLNLGAARYGNWLVSEFKKASAANRIEAMLKAYHPSLHTCAALTLPERQQLVHVQRALANAALIREAIPAGDLIAIRRASSPELQPFLNALLSPSEIKTVQQVALTAVTI